MDALYVFGTGHALVTKLYNTCYALYDGTSFFHLDGGGGSQILAIWEQMRVSPGLVRNLFISHRHIDHILGCVWIVRKIAEEMLLDRYAGIFRVYAHDPLMQTFLSICRGTLQPSLRSLFDRRILFIAVKDRQTVELDSAHRVTFFDTGSANVDQFGCRLTGRSGRRITFLGDEPYHPCSAEYVEDCDWLIAEALCLESEDRIHRAHATHHSTVKDACVIAERLRVKNLVIAHTEDTHGAEHKLLYAVEGSAYYHGNLWVPDDREIIALDQSADPIVSREHLNT